MPRVLIKEQVSLLFEVSQQGRGHECILVMFGEVFVAIRRTIIIALWVFVELVDDEFLSGFGVQHCFYMLKKVQCAFSTFSVIWSLYEPSRTCLTSDVGLSMPETVWTALLISALILFLLRSAIFK